MIGFPNCKINLGLHIIEKRSDGYHNLETVFYPLPLTDILEIIPAAHLSQAFPSLSLSGLPVAGEPEKNLCIKAWQLLKKDFRDLPPVQMHLHKKIPMGAGLGGGSADGAFVLIQLNAVFNLGLAPARLAAYALELGSDCPFFIYNTPAFAEGRGEILRPLSLDLSNYSWLIVNPQIHIGTAQAFSRVVPGKPSINLTDTILRPVTEWEGRIRNDFEASAFYYYPNLVEVKEWLYAQGALYASMSGSGSCFYGLFRKGEIPDRIQVEGWAFYPII